MDEILIPSSPDKILSRDDMFILLKTYETNVRLNTTVLEILKKIVEEQNNTIEKVTELTKETSILAKNISELFSEHNRELIKNLTEHNLKELETKGIILSHINDLKNKIWYLYAGVFVIFLNLIGLLISIWNKTPSTP